MAWWKWSQPEQRHNSGADYPSALNRLIEASAIGAVADNASTAAVEACAGALASAFASATVQGPAWVQGAISPKFLAQVGRDLIRQGQSLHVITLTRRGNLSLFPASQWHCEGGGNPRSWHVRATY